MWFNMDRNKKLLARAGSVAQKSRDGQLWCEQLMDVLLMVPAICTDESDQMGREKVCVYKSKMKANNNNN